MENVLFTFAEVLRAVRGKPLGHFDPEKTVSSVSTDTRAPMPGALFLALKGESFDAHKFLPDAIRNGAVLLCIQESSAGLLPEGVPAVAVADTVKAYQDLAAFHRARFPGLLTAALTGSCGKTSTKEAVRAIFESVYGKEHVLATVGNTNNQIGVPRNLLNLTSGHCAAVLEAGTNHHGEIAPLAACIRPKHALIVSIRAVHVENLGSLEGVAEEKSHIFDNLPDDGGGVIPYACAGNDILRNALRGHKILTFGAEPDADFRAEYLGGNLHGASFRLTQKETGKTVQVNWSVPGAHQACNAAGAAALASLFGISLAQSAKGLAATTLPGMRMRIAEHGGATWINDAYNANPDSMKASLSWLKEFADESKLVLILGDMLELGEQEGEGHRSTLEFARKNFPHARIYIVGSRMKAADPGLADACFSHSGEAAAEIPARIQSGDLVFLKASNSIHLEKVEPEG